MIALKLVFQSLAGVGAVVGVAGSSYYVMQQETKPENYSYLLVQAKTKESSETLSTENLATSLTERNYFCEITKRDDVKVTDSFCEIFKSNLDLTNTSKEIDLSLINEEIGLVNKNNDLVAERNYLLKINKKKYSEGIKEIAIIENLKLGGKSFGKLTPVFEFKTDIKDLSSNLIIVQASKNLVTTPVTIDATKKTVCSVGVESAKFDCDIYKPTTEKTINDFSSSDLKASTKIATTSNIKANNFYLLDLKNKEYKKSEFSNKQFKIFHQAVPTNTNDSSTTDVEITTLNFIQLVAGDLTQTTKLAFLISPSIETYVVKVKTETDNGLNTQLIDSEIKKYSCKYGEFEDKTCELFQIGFDASKDSIASTSISSSLTRESSKEKLKTGKFFKLQINKNNLQNITFSSITPSTIDLISTTDATKKYATFTLNYKLLNNNLIGKTTFALVKPVVNTSISDATFPTNLKCQLNNSSDKETCNVYKFSTAPTVKETLKFSEATTPTAKTDIVSANFLAIDLKNTEINLSKSYRTISVFNSASSNQKLFEATIETPFIANLSSAKKFSEVITIK